MNNTMLLLGGEGGMNPIVLIAMVALFAVVMIIPMIKNKKQEKKDAQMRDEIQPGDEVTTIGGIIGKVVSVKGETFVLETTKAKTRIRFLKGAIRSVDVRITDTLAPKADDEKKDTDAKAIEPQAPVADEKPAKKKAKKADAEAAVEAPAAEPQATEEKSEG